MAGYKETPRQKMIGMMYLVLTALLALNVSKDILNAFVIVNEGLKTSQVNTSSKNSLIYSNFDKAMLTDSAKVKPFVDKALKAKKYSQDIAKYIDELRTKIIAYTEFGIKEKASDPEKWNIADTMKLANVGAKDNYDKPMEILIGQAAEGADGEGMVLKNKLDQYKKDMLSLLDEKDRKNAEKSFPIRTEPMWSVTENSMQPWVQSMFFHTVLAADVALLNKMLIDVKTVEGDVISKLFSAVDASNFKFDKIAAKVVAESNYILAGGQYKANIFLAAYDSKKMPDIYIGADTINHTGGELLDKTLFEDGMGVYSRGTAGTGEQKYTGWISVVKPGETTPTCYNFSSSYFVGKPSATVSADKMNVFYIGVDNPVTISVPGVPNDAVKASMTVGTLTPKGGGSYNVVVTAGAPKTTVNVSATVGGKLQNMGSAEFRIKKVPTPIAKIGGKSDGLISKAVLAASRTIIPVMENFDFELFFRVTSFTMTMNVKGDLIEKKSNGASLTTEMISMINAAKSGTKVYLEDIKAYGAGETRSLSAINLKLTN